MGTTPLWVPLVVAVFGVVGTLGAAYLTQRNANRREKLQWERMRIQEEDAHRRRRDEEHHQWMRDKRHQVYADLIRASRSFAMELVPLIDMGERIQDPRSALYKIRDEYFELQYQASFLADDQLQAVLATAGDNAENVGHAPYGEDGNKRQRQFESEMLQEAFAIIKSLEDAARRELGLPARRERE